MLFFKHFQKVYRISRQQNFKWAFGSTIFSSSAESIVTFDIKKFKLPLKFIGSEQTTSPYPEKNEQVKGQITLTYSYHKI